MCFSCLRNTRKIVPASHKIQNNVRYDIPVKCNLMALDAELKICNGSNWITVLMRKNRAFYQWTIAAKEKRYFLLFIFHIKIKTSDNIRRAHCSAYREESIYNEQNHHLLSRLAFRESCANRWMQHFDCTCKAHLTHR